MSVLQLIINKNLSKSLNNLIPYNKKKMILLLDHRKYLNTSITFGKFNSCLVNLHGVYTHYFYGFFSQLNQATMPLQLYHTA